MPFRYSLLCILGALFLTGCASQSVVTSGTRPAARPASATAPRTPRAPQPVIVEESPVRRPEPTPLPEPAAPLVMPVEGYSHARLRDQYDQARSGGRVHEAIDLGAPTGTRIVSAAAGRVRRMTSGGLGGIAVTVQSRDAHLLYYYAHLSRYADGLHEGQTVEAGDLLGYVGTTGNATVPHLHFAIWYAGSNGYRTGQPVNPYPLLAHGGLPPTRSTPTSPVEIPRRPAVTVTRTPLSTDAQATPREETTDARRPAVTVTRTPTSSRVPPQPASRPPSERRPSVAGTRPSTAPKRDPEETRPRPPAVASTRGPSPPSEAPRGW